MLSYSPAEITAADAHIAERLSHEFGDRVPVTIITSMLGQCRAQLSTSPETAMPELLERLARQRLTCPPLTNATAR